MTMKFTLRDYLNILSIGFKQCLGATPANKHRYYSTNDNRNQNNNIIDIIPIESYINPYQNRNVIYQDNKNKPDIYRWVNLIDNKSYIGSSINLTSRFYGYLSNNHMINNLSRHNSIIYKALMKYNYDNFRL